MCERLWFLAGIGLLDAFGVRRRQQQSGISENGESDALRAGITFELPPGTFKRKSPIVLRVERFSGRKEVHETNTSGNARQGLRMPKNTT